MLGFGLPSALSTFIFPQFLGLGVYALAFPISIIFAVTSTPVQHEPTKLFPRNLSMFFFAEYVTLGIVRQIKLRLLPRGPSSSS